MSDAVLMDRIRRLIRKNATALGEEVKVRARQLPSGRVKVEWQPDAALTDDERAVKPRIYRSVELAYRASLKSHLRAHDYIRRMRGET